jgi:hypothetical protein
MISGHGNVFRGPETSSFLIIATASAYETEVSNESDDTGYHVNLEGRPTIGS